LPRRFVRNLGRFGPASSSAFVSQSSREISGAAVAFLRRAVAWFAERGVRVQAVMTDNGSCYVAYAYAAAARKLGLRRLRIRP